MSKHLNTRVVLNFNYHVLFVVDDLPDSQGLLSQHTENPLSPAVLIAAQPKKDRAKIHCVTPDTDPDEMIRRIQMGRRKKGDFGMKM